MCLRRLILAASLLLAACAAPGVREVRNDPHLPRQQELAATPFFSQERYQCGPAALATALTAIGIDTRPEQLTPEIFIPGRQGSLQLEMLAAARRHGALAIRIPPRLDALLQEVAAGNNVVVLQNLGLSWIPAWHYAVVVGYDLDAGLIWLRSGTTRRQEMTLNTFQHTWSRAGHWGFVTVKPGDLPASAGMDAVTKALLTYEKSAPAARAKEAYAAAVHRWNDNLVLLMGLGNTAYLSGDMGTASNAFRRAIAVQPESAAAYNNLASTLLAQGSVDEAQDMADRALALAEKEPRLRPQIQETLNEIQRYRSTRTR